MSTPSNSTPLPAYAELHCLSNFTFLRGASSAAELCEHAKKQGYRALAITDECSVAGVVRAYEAAKKHDLKLIIGSEIQLHDGPRIVLLAQNKAGYSNLCAIISKARRMADKGEYKISCDDLSALPRENLMAILLPAYNIRDLDDGKTITWLQSIFAQSAWLALSLQRQAYDTRHLENLQTLSARFQIPLVACGDVHMHSRQRKALQDVVTAIRLNTTVAQAGFALQANGEKHLRPRKQLAQIYPACAIVESVRIADQCHFCLSELRYEYPSEVVPRDKTAAQHLRELTESGSAWRWPNGVSSKVRAQIEHELKLISEMHYEHYFLTVHDIVRFARAQGILCQGRGSAANSAVCFALGITEVDPARMSMLFERFISKERNEPPDIDVDFEHERREEVFQYIYNKYGRERAALTATVICYRRKSALRDVGKALGMSLDQLEQLSAAISWKSDREQTAQRLQERGFDIGTRRIQQLLDLSQQLSGFPRHLSQHVGGFIISQQPLHELVPIENAAMPDRTVIQWDKDDLDTLGFLKIDCLALGMLTCLHRCFDLLRQHRGIDLDPARVPAEDHTTYAMIQRADTLGVFQIESRAQMSMLPRLKPATFYDLVIEVALVRPGPIQGKMVHPYLRRRQGLEPVVYPSGALRAVFERTLGVPIFQEQVMQLVIVAAGFSAGEADHLRRSMAAWKRHGTLEHFQQRIIGGMTERGYPLEFAQQVFEQILGFGSYGFPESHAASFALLVYVSCWLKCHHPDIFAAGLLNSQPMGFYQPAQIIQDAQRHGVPVRPPDVCYSDWDCGLESIAGQDNLERKPLALRLGLRLVNGLAGDCAGRIVSARCEQKFTSVQDLVARAKLNRFEKQRLAEAGALRTLAGHKHRAAWEVAGAENLPALLENTEFREEKIALKPPAAIENTISDYAHLGFTLGDHPIRLIRNTLKARRVSSAKQLAQAQDGAQVCAAGLVVVRQRPGTAAGVTFVTLEDETGSVNVVVWLAVAEAHRRELLESTVLGIEGHMQYADGVRHLIAKRLLDWSDLIANLNSKARNFH